MNKERIAEASGVSPERIQTIRMNLRKLREKGALVQIHCFGLSKTLDRQATNSERGIADDDVRARRITKGRVKTLPRERVGQFLTLRETARARLDNPFTSFNITGFRPWRYIPVARFQKWLAGQEQLEADWETLKEECVAELDRFRESERERCLEVAHKSWKAIWSNADKKGRAIVQVDGRAYTRQEEEIFAERLVVHALANIPTPTDIQAMSLSWEVGGIEAQSDIAQEAAAEAEAEAAQARARAELAQATEDEARANFALNEGERAREAEIAQMNTIVAAKLREQLAGLPDPGVEMLEQLKGAIGDSVVRVRKSLDDKGQLYKGTSNAIFNITESFEDVNPGDAELEEAIARLRASMRRVDGRYSYPEIRESLEHVEAVCTSKKMKVVDISSAAEELSALD